MITIIGGGINGVGIARECALRGFDVLLLEKGDIGSGTSSASSKLVHGGLRYLKQGQFKLVFEALQERELLLKNAPHLVHPLPFLIPIYRHDIHPKWLVKLGMIFYDILSRGKQLKSHRMVSTSEALELEPTLNQEGLIGAAIYYDAQMNDSRLCLENALQAEQYGAKIKTYHQVTGISPKTTGCVTVSYRNIETQEEFNQESTVVINTTGAWSDETLSLLPTPSKQRLRPSKGVHLVTKKWKTNHAIVLHTKKDQRLYFVIPWEDNTSLIGTTDTDYSGSPDNINVTDEDIDYLIQETNLNFPSLQLTKDDIISSFSGLRPLIKQTSGTASSVSREHQCIWNGSVMTLIGGKFSTYRHISEEVTKELCQRFKQALPFKSLTKELPLIGSHVPDINQYISTHFHIDCQNIPLPKQQYEKIVRRFGEPYKKLITILEETPSLCENLEGSSHTQGEVVYAIRYEYAKTLEDFMRRRTHLMLLEGQGFQCLEIISEIFKKELNWNEEKRLAEVSKYKKTIQT